MSVPANIVSTSFRTSTGPVIIHLKLVFSLTVDVVFFTIKSFASPAFTMVHSTVSPGDSVTVSPRFSGHPAPVIESNL